LFVAVLATLVVASLAAQAKAGIGAPAYPDLQMASPTDFHLTTADVGGETHYQVHFSTVPWNAGKGALEVRRDPTLSGIADLKQRVYESPAGFRDIQLGSVVFDPADFIFPIPDFARYELWTERGFARAQARHFKRGRPLAVRLSVGHCVADLIQMQDSAGPDVYRICSKFVTGLSPGWGDLEDWFNDAQSVDVGTSPLPDGAYVVRAIVDPNNMIYESDGKADPAREGEVANSGIAYLEIVQGKIAGVDDRFQ
jgi:hypothetical protein